MTNFRDGETFFDPVEVQINRDKTNWTMEELAEMVKDRALTMILLDGNEVTPQNAVFKTQLKDYIESLNLDRPQILWQHIEAYCWACMSAGQKQASLDMKDKILNVIDKL